jgi:Ca2+-binding EF-hand superfamily protein
MKRLVLVVGICGAAAMVSLTAQDRGFGGPRPVSRLVSALDVDRDGTISSAEIKAAPTAISKLDANGDGRVTAEEMRPAFGPEGGRGVGGEGGGRGELGGPGGPGGPGATPAMSADELADTLMAFDRNGDGTLAKAEVPERFLGLFDRADGNKDGVLTKDELKQSANASVQEAARAGERGGRGGEGGRGGFGRGEGGRGPGGMVDPLLRALDKDGDGALSQAEIVDAARNLLSLDGNKDGQLSADEYRMAGPGGPGRAGEGR